MSDVAFVEQLQGEIAELEEILASKRRELRWRRRLEGATKRAERANARTWEVAWYQSLLLTAGMGVEPETLEDGLTEEEAQIKRIEWASSLAGGVGVVVIARLSPQAEEAHDE